ncbi:MAG: insulinase family protein [Cyclobacteriaceae bacterium]|nr:insulinase family protein [Cyclobacteriaceae bacterium]
MIAYQQHVFPNGLTLITNTDQNTPLLVVNILYKVGSRNEHPDKTGFAHLFEHLMFGGSRHVPDYDKRLQQVGAENNAFTNTDITNYYIILGAENIETALWVESDRMQFLNLDQKSLDTQKNVVIEEFKQRYLNVPYGDVWLKLRPLAYKTHPYRWATIGKEIGHIENASLNDVQQFHSTFYGPENAVITLAGNINHQLAIDLVGKWFGNIPRGTAQIENLPVELPQLTGRHLQIEENVPLDAIYKAYHMPGRTDKKYVVADLLSDVLGHGKSSPLYQHLVKEEQIFSNINAYITGSADPGLLVVSGKVNPGVSLEKAEQYILEEITSLKATLKQEDIEKVINQAQSTTYFAETELLNKAINLSLSNALGDTSLINDEIERIGKVSRQEIEQMAGEILVPENCNTIYYKSTSKA